jgi:putative spermidine/putrescine transport system permease protein
MLVIEYALQPEEGGLTRIFRSDAYTNSLLRTIAISAQATGFCIGLAYIYAGALFVAKGALRAFLMGALLLSFFTSALTRSYAWTILLGNNGPVLRAVGEALGESDVPEILYTRAGLLFGIVHVLLPFAVLPLYAVMAAVPKDLIRAARSLGANKARSYLHVGFPLTLPGAVAGGVLVFMQALGFYVTPALLAGPGDTMVAQLVDRDLNLYANISQASALGIVLLGSVLSVFLLFRFLYPFELLFDATGRHGQNRALGRQLLSRLRLQRRLRGSAAGAEASSAAKRAVRAWTDKISNALSRPNWRPVLLLVGTGLGIYFLLPLVVLIPASLTAMDFLQFPPESYSFRWYASVLGDGEWRRAFANSVLVGGVAAVICAAAGMPLGITLVRGELPQKLRAGAMLMLSLPVVMPLVVLSVGIFVWFGEMGVLGNRLALGFAHAAIGLPFFTFVFMAGLRGLDPTLEKAARSLGASAMRTMRYITLPLASRAAGGAIFFAFLVSFDELVIARATTDFRSTTVPVKLFAGTNWELGPALTVVGVLNILLAAVALAAVASLRRIRAVGESQDQQLT